VPRFFLVQMFCRNPAIPTIIPKTDVDAQYSIFHPGGWERLRSLILWDQEGCRDLCCDLLLGGSWLEVVAAGWSADTGADVEVFSGCRSW